MALVYGLDSTRVNLVTAEGYQEGSKLKKETRY